MERDSNFFYDFGHFVDFNSHAHVERDCQDSAYGGKTDISTHTLTWSVTRVDLVLTYSKNISTHTLTCSVTLSFSVVFVGWYFNSHAHVERDYIRI